MGVQQSSAPIYGGAPFTPTGINGAGPEAGPRTHHDNPYYDHRVDMQNRWSDINALHSALGAALQRSSFTPEQIGHLVVMARRGMITPEVTDRMFGHGREASRGATLAYQDMFAPIREARAGVREARADMRAGGDRELFLQALDNLKNVRRPIRQADRRQEFV
jgi:hypothetical protein